MRSVKKEWVLRRKECSRILSIFNNAPAVVKRKTLILFPYPSYLKTSPEKRNQETQPFHPLVRTAEGSYLFFLPLETKLCPKSTTFRKSIHVSEIKCALAFSREHFSLICTFLPRTHVAYLATASNLKRQKRYST